MHQSPIAESLSVWKQSNSASPHRRDRSLLSPVWHHQRQRTQQQQGQSQKLFWVQYSWTSDRGPVAQQGIVNPPRHYIHVTWPQKHFSDGVGVIFGHGPHTFSLLQMPKNNNNNNSRITSVNVIEVWLPGWTFVNPDYSHKRPGPCLGPTCFIRMRSALRLPLRCSISRGLSHLSESLQHCGETSARPPCGSSCHTAAGSRY